MKKLSVALALAVGTLAAHAQITPSTLSYTNSATAGGNNTFVDLALNKFDTGLGTLTGVVVTVNFARLGGSFTVSTPAEATEVATVLDDPAPLGRVTVRQSTNNALGFTQLGQTPVAIATTPGLPFEVPAPNGLQQFAVTTTNVWTDQSQNIASGFWSAYQSAGGVGSVIFQVRNSPDISISGGFYSLNSLAFTAEANMIVTYTYESGPTPVPEPGTWAVGALLFGGAGFTAWRRRRAVAAA